MGDRTGLHLGSGGTSLSDTAEEARRISRPSYADNLHLQGLKSEDGKTRDGSRYFLQQLLAAPQPPGAAGIVLNGHAATNGAAAQCLAAEVLSGQTDTQHWLRNTAKSFRAGASGCA